VTATSSRTTIWSASIAISAKGRRTIEDCFATIETKLRRDHAVGESFTAVDPFLLVFYRWGNVIGIDMAKAYADYARFAHNHGRRASVVKALAAEGIRLEGAS
jgi:glutathione S-transferase